MGETQPGGKYRGVDGKLHNADGDRINEPRQKAKKKGKPKKQVAKPVAVEAPAEVKEE
jgi:hypothetical protein